MNVTVAVNGKRYEVEYAKKGEEYIIQVPDPSWIAPLQNPIRVLDRERKTLKMDAPIPVETEELALEIFRQVKEYDAQRGQA